MVYRVRDIEFWRITAFVLAAFLAMALVGTISLAIAYQRSDNYVLPDSLTATIVPAEPAQTASPPESVPAPAPDLADQVAVAWAVATGWPNSEKWGYILAFTSVDDDLLVHTNLDAPTDLSELCTLLFQLNDPVLALDPQIDQALALGAGNQIVWSCSVTAEVQ